MLSHLCIKFILQHNNNKNDNVQFDKLFKYFIVVPPNCTGILFIVKVVFNFFLNIDILYNINIYRKEDEYIINI